MNLLDITPGMPLAILNEANVLNIKQPYNGMSIAEYVKDYAKHLATPQVQNIFAKKLGKLLVNDERFHSAVRELPADAPEWAQQALASGELVAFEPTEDLNQNIEHMVHYVVALETDSASKDKNNAAAQNKAVIAKRELDAFPKAESLDVLITKSQEYFDRGTNTAVGDADGTEGMTQLFDAGDGFIWYKLDTIAAFKQEGQTLRNCIGKFYTPETVKADGQTVIVMRKGNNESVVAARIDNEDKQIIEMKGKNNKPPVARYIPPVSRFMDKFRLTPSEAARRDFNNAGYHFVEGSLYTRPEVIQKFVNNRKLGEAGHGKMVTVTESQARGNGTSITSQQAIVMAVYPEFFRVNYIGGLADQFIKDSDKQYIYNLTENGKVLITMLVVDQTLYKIDRHENLTENDESINTDTHNVDVQLLANYLWFNGICHEIHKMTADEMEWKDRLELTDEDGFLPVRVEGTREHGDTKWEEHTDKDRVSRLDRELKDSNKDISHYSSKKRMKTKEGPAEKIFMTRFVHGDTKDKTSIGQLVVMKKDGYAIPHFVDSNGKSTTMKLGSGTANFLDNGYVDLRIAKSMAALANHEKLKLPVGYANDSGIYQDENETWQVYNPEFTTTSSETPRATKADLSKIPKEGRLAAIKRIDSFSGHRIRKTDKGAIIRLPDDRAGRTVSTPSDFQFDAVTTKALTGKNKYNHWSYEDVWDSAGDWGDLTGATILQQRFKHLPDAVHLVEIPYGPGSRSQEVMIVTSGKNAVGIDNSTLQHKYQSWDDFDKVAALLNTWADKNGMTFTTTAIKSKGKEQNELRIVRGKVSTVAANARARLDRQTAKGQIGTEGADEIPFANTWKIVRLTPDEQVNWTRKQIKSDPTGQAWALKDNDGKIQSIAMVQKGRIDKIYQMDYNLQNQMTDGAEFYANGRWQTYTPADAANLMPTVVGLHKEFMGFWKAAMDNFDWDIKHIPSLGIAKDSNQHKLLKALEDMGGAQPRKQVMVRADISSGYRKVWDRPGAPDKILYDFNLISMRRVGSAKLLSLTTYGRAALRALEQGNYSLFTNARPKETAEGFSKPAKKEPPAPAPRAPRPAGPAGERTPRTPMAGGEKKSVRAMRWYTEFAQENERLPTRGETMTVLQAEPYNMSKAGASTYAHNIKKKYASLNETYSVLASLELMLEEHQTYTGQVL